MPYFCLFYPHFLTDESEYVTLQQEITGEPKVYISLTLLNPETSYQFSVIAINDQGISLPSVPSDVFVTPGLGKLLSRDFTVFTA